VVLGLRKPDTRIRVLEFDEIHVTEDVIAVGVLVAIALREGTTGSVPLDQAHNRIMRPARRSRQLGGGVPARDLRDT